MQASISFPGNEFSQIEDLSAQNSLILNHEEDLLDLEWSEKNSENVSSRQEHQSAHLELLRRAFATDLDDTPRTGSISSAILAPSLHEAKNGDPQGPFRDVDFSQDTQQLDEQENLEDAIDSSPSKEAPTLAKVDPIHDSAWMTGGPVPELVSAVIRGDLEKVTELLDAGHDINSRHPENGRTGAIFAALLNHSKVLELLLDRGASVGACDLDGRTALHFSASEGFCK
jgi:ankyrin repeat protein